MSNQKNQKEEGLSLHHVDACDRKDQMEVDMYNQTKKESDREEKGQYSDGGEDKGQPMIDLEITQA